MPSSNDLIGKFGEDLQSQTSQSKRPRTWRLLNGCLDCVLIFAVIALGIWVLLLKLEREPGVHVQFINNSGQALKDVGVSLPWCEYVHSTLTTEPRKEWWTPHSVTFQLIGNSTSQTCDLKIVWTDAKGVKHLHIEKELYLGMQSELLILTFNADGTVTVKQKALSFL